MFENSRKPAKNVLGPNNALFTLQDPYKQPRPNQADEARPAAPQVDMSKYGGSKPQQGGVVSPFGTFANMSEYQRYQDAFTQQFLQSQHQYNQALNRGEHPSKVDLGQAWSQAGDNIANGTYQGNPFATGNVDGMIGMFNMYGIPVPDNFRDQLIAQVGQQAPPSMYPQQYIGTPQANYPGFPSPQASSGPTGGYPPFHPFEQPIPIGYPGGDYSLPGEVYQPSPGDGPALYRTGPQSGPTGPQGEYYPGGPMTPAAPQRNDRGGDDWGFRPFVEPEQTPDQQRRAAQLQRQAEEAAARARYERQIAEMQSRYPTRDPVMRNGRVTGWEPNAERTAAAERAREQTLQDQGYILGAIKPDGEKVWISPQQQAVRAARPSPTAAQPKPEASSGTKYVPPSQRKGPTGDEEYDSWFRKLTRPARRR